MSGTLQSLASSLITRGDRPALIEFRQDDFQQWSYSQIAAMARDLASGLTEAGVKQHDRGMLLGSNRSDWIIACLALLTAGAVPVPADFHMAEEELKHAIKDSDPEKKSFCWTKDRAFLSGS